MPTFEEKIFREELANLPTVSYPQEVVERWMKEAEITRLKIATGEFIPKTVDELAAELGINRDFFIFLRAIQP